MNVKMVVTEIKPADSKAKGFLEEKIFATLSDVPSGQNSPVKNRSRHQK
jgi:hypothetical protein